MPIRRLTVALDASPGSLTALEVAVELAARADGELLGLFVEDLNLLRWAALPFARQVGARSAVVRRVSDVEVARQLRLQAEAARRALVRAARGRGLTPGFRVARGSVVDELLAVVTEGDLLLLGKGGWTVRGDVALGSTARAVAGVSRGRILMLPPKGRLGGPVGVLYDASGAGQRALAAALHLVEHPAEDLWVLCLARSREAFEELAEMARASLSAQGLTGRFHHLARADAATLPGQLRSLGVRVLVAPSESPALPAGALTEVASGFPGPVLLVGPAERGKEEGAGGPARHSGTPD